MIEKKSHAAVGHIIETFKSASFRGSLGEGVVGDDYLSMNMAEARQGS